MSTLIERVCIRDTDSILDAIARIEATPFQMVFVICDSGVVKGIITNGDVRRYLLNNGDAKAQAATCMNRNFRSVGVDASREELLKMLDLGYGVIPQVDANGHLLNVLTRDYVLASPEVPVLTRARAPVRVSFGGGGSDLTYYFLDNPGAVLSTTVALYSHATLIPRSDREIHIYSEDMGTHIHYSSLAELLSAPRSDLLSSVVAAVKPNFGFQLYVHSDFPVGSGLGGSSAVATAVVATFNEMRLDRWTTYEVAELAFHAERVCFGSAGGWQDQYAAAFGGFNLIELHEKQNLVHAIRLEASTRNELEECLILCDTQIKHDSSALHKIQKAAFNNEDKAEQLKQTVSICREMHRHLIRGELLDFARLLDQAWTVKSSLSSAINSAEINLIYTEARKAGALGGKLLGAGGGGFFLFFVQPQCRARVAAKLQELNCKLSVFKFENEGVTSCRTKIQ